MPHMLSAEHLSFVNALNYGAARNDATISAALAAIGSTPAVLLFANDGDGIWTLNSPHTFPANVIVYIPAGVAIAGTGALTINGLVRADSAVWYAGTGGVTFPPSDVFAYFNRIVARQLGLNTNTPLAMIHGSGDVGFPATFLLEQRTVGAGNAGVEFWSAGTSRAFLGLVNAAGGLNLQLVLGPAGGSFLIGKQGTGALVGLNTTNPQAQLHMTGDGTTPATLRLEENLPGAGGAALQFYSAGTSRGSLGLPGTQDVTLQLNSGARFLVSGGNVGLGMIPTLQLELSTGGAQKATGTAWTNPSDQRLKTIQRAFTDGLNVVLHTQPYWVTFNGQAGTDTDTPEFVAILAQELQPYAPYMIGTYEATLQPDDPVPTTLFNYDGSAMTFALVNAVKELAATCDAQAHQIATLQTQVADLTTRLAALEALTGDRADALEAAAHTHGGSGNAGVVQPYDPPGTQATHATQKKRHGR